MTELEEVARHYSHGSLEAAIRAGLKAMGRVDAEVTPDDLAGIDEFHIGGHEATADLGDKLEIGSGATLLDISACDQLDHLVAEKTFTPRQAGAHRRSG